MTPHLVTRSWMPWLLLLALAACGGGNGGGNGTGGGGGTAPAVTQVTIAPAAGTVQVGETAQFVATVSGTGAFDTSVRWSVNGVANGSAEVGTVTDTGLYVTPFPAPASVTLTATSRGDSTRSASATLTIAPPPPGQGPALEVDAATGRHPISPYIYSTNAFLADFDRVAQGLRLPLVRWGGNMITRYNYQLDVYNAAADWYFTVSPNSNAGYPDASEVNTMVARNQRLGLETIVGVPTVGWTTRRQPSCGFSVAKYGAQKATNPYNADCGNGVRIDGTDIIADPTDTSTPIGPEYVNGYVRYLVSKYGSARSGGVAMYSLDNEPELWQFVHKDVHPQYSGYDDLGGMGLAYAAAIKQADPTALVTGPVFAGWMAFDYSPKDWKSGWSTGPDYTHWGNPVDRKAHGDVPLTEWYLQQFAAAERRTGRRLLDYLDVHGYFGLSDVEFRPAGDTNNQRLRLETVRVFWDPAYRLGGYINDAPALVRRMRGWVSRNYPGTKTAITEYNLGAIDHINGALAQADLLGAFGREGLDLATIWADPKPGTPLFHAFKVYRNYDDAAGEFGNVGVRASSADESRLSVYAAERTRDRTLTILVVNKTFGDLRATISLRGWSGEAQASVWRYGPAALDRIDHLPDLPIGRTSVEASFPAASITLFVIPER
jgi:hypothetical protein